MERESAWKGYDEADLERLEALAADYKQFISTCKTERECCVESVRQAEAAGYVALSTVLREGRQLRAGDKVWATSQGKALVLVHIGEEPMEHGMNILGAHIDSPRLDVKQNPLYEKDGFTLLDTHYYGGIKKYQWVALPLAIHGVVAKTDGSVVDIVVGEDADDPVFCVTDLLPHLGQKQMEKKGSEVVEGEDLDVLVGNRAAALGVRPGGLGCAQSLKQSSLCCGTRLVSAPEPSGTEEPLPEDAAAQSSEVGTMPDQNASSDDLPREEREKEPVKAFLLGLLREKYGIEEEDFLSAELEVVPAGAARDMGFDRSMVIGYGQDDRVCAYTSLRAQLALASGPAPQKTAVCVLVDKEEIGSVGATGMESAFFENAIAEVMARAGEEGELRLRRALAASRMLSSDVSAGVDPAYASVFEPKNSAYLGRGLVFNKYTGARGKSGSNDARAEFVARVRRVMDDAHVSFQTAELGRVDAGGGGTIAFIPARFGMDVIDSGVPVLSMHSPWEVTSKADIYEARRGYEAFLRNA